MDQKSIRNMIGVVNRVLIFFAAHPKRQEKLEDAIDIIESRSTVRKLKDLCQTRWVERIDALERFRKLYTSLISCFETISVDLSGKWTSESLTDAITSFCLNYLMALTKSLQSEAKDIVQAVSEINHITSVFCDLREKMEDHHNEWYTEVEKLGEAIGIVPSLPRLCTRQTHRSNVPAETPKE